MTAISNLVYRYSYPRYATDLPVVLLMHGWSGDATSFGNAALRRIAGYGVFAAAVGLRGRNSADGSRDASAREIYDIYDALTTIRTNFASAVSADKAALVGYSGGGGNALAAACKFPDTWSVVASHFGMSDYGRDATDGWYYNNGGGYGSEVVTAVGGTPVAVPDNYYARDATAAITNYSGGHLYLFHDAADTSVPIVHSRRIQTALAAAGYTNYTANFTTATDALRWYHGYPSTTDQPNLIQTERLWMPAVRAQPAWTIAAAGTVTVIGYLVTKRFSVWLGDGTAEAATVVYDTTADRYTVTPLTGSVSVSITQGAKTASQTISSETELTVV